MKYIILALLALVSLGFFLNFQTPAAAPSVALQSTPSVPSEIVEHFNTWKLQYHKNYASPEELEYRLQVFYTNVLYINEQNTVQKDYVLGETAFMDLTNEEFVATYLGLIPSTESAEDVEEDFVPSNAAFNWASKSGVVTPVKNQGSCGSCWAFSTTGVVEGYWGINKGSLPSLSEQQLVDCAGLAYGNLGCNGGNPYNTLAYVINKGLVTESQYPYTGRDGTCKINSGPYKPNSRKKTSGCSTLTADIQTQPTSVAVDASNWSFYKSGVFSNCGTRLNHAVLATGWDA
jgi:C1A family cysteine protease